GRCSRSTGRARARRRRSRGARRRRAAGARVRGAAALLQTTTLILVCGLNSCCRGGDGGLFGGAGLCAADNTAGSAWGVKKGARGGEPGLPHVKGGFWSARRRRE